MAASASEDRARRRQRLRERRRVVFERIIAALEALQAAGVPAWLILPLHDDRAVEVLVEAGDMPTKSRAARLLRRALGDVAHHLAFTGDLPPERLSALRSASMDLEGLRKHRHDLAA